MRTPIVFLIICFSCKIDKTNYSIKPPMKNEKSSLAESNHSVPEFYTFRLLLRQDFCYTYRCERLDCVFAVVRLVSGRVA